MRCCASASVVDFGQHPDDFAHHRRENPRPMVHPLRTSALELEDPEDPDRFLLHPVVELYVGLRSLGVGCSPTDAVTGELRSRTKPGDRIWVAGHRARAYPAWLARALPDRVFVATLATQESAQGLMTAATALGLNNLSVETAAADRAQAVEPESLAAITAISALHHLQNPAAFWDTARAGLRAKGVVLTMGFCGPDRLEWTDAQRDAANRAMAQLPDDDKPHHSSVDDATFASVIRANPAYCAHASQIREEAVNAGMEILGQAKAGCSLLRPIVLAQANAWNPTDWAANERLAGLLRQEDELLADGTLTDDLEMFVAAKPG